MEAKVSAWPSQPEEFCLDPLEVSAVLHHDIRPATLAARLANRRALIMSGSRDDRVPWEYVDGDASQFERAEMQVTKRRFANDDHFLFFRRSAEVITEVSQWLMNHRL